MPRMLSQRGTRRVCQGSFVVAFEVEGLSTPNMPSDVFAWAEFHSDIATAVRDVSGRVINLLIVLCGDHVCEHASIHLFVWSHTARIQNNIGRRFVDHNKHWLSRLV